MTDLKRRVLIAGLFLSAAFLFGQEVIEDIVAVVNGEIITRSEVLSRYELMLQALRAQTSGEPLEQQTALLKKNLLNSMITDLLLLQKARELKLDVREQVRLTIDNIKSQNGLESDEDLRAALRREGLDYNRWVKQMEEDLLRQAVIFSEVDRKIVLDDSDVVNEYKTHPQDFTEPEEIRLSGIILSADPASDETVEAHKTDILGRLAAGGDFAALAEEFSEGPLKEQKGDLGVFRKGELDPVLEKAVQDLQPGQVSDWVRTRNAWYLLRLESRKPARLKPFEEVKEDVERNLFAKKRAKAVEEYLDSEKKKNSIKILRPEVLDH